MNDYLCIQSKRRLTKVIEICTGQKQRSKVLLRNSCFKTLREVRKKTSPMENIIFVMLQDTR